MNKTPDQRTALGLSAEPTNDNHPYTEHEYYDCDTRYPLIVALLFLLMGMMLGFIIATTVFLYITYSA